MEDELINNYPEELRCTICTNIFEDPRILKCGHTFCFSCLKNLSLKSISFC